MESDNEKLSTLQEELDQLRDMLDAASYERSRQDEHDVVCWRILALLKHHRFRFEEGGLVLDLPQLRRGLWGRMEDRKTQPPSPRRRTPSPAMEPGGVVEWLFP